MKASRQYGTIDWCVGVFKTPAKTLTVVTSGEGAGFIPAGVHLPKGVESLFSDSGLDNAFRRRWFGWINPAQTMVAYAQSVTALDPNIELWAVAVSTGFGGSAQPARAAGVPHYADCPVPTDSPLGGGVAQPPLDETRLHRLQALNPAAYAQLNTATPVDVRESLAITRQTAHVTFTQAGELLTLPIPPLLREIATHLDRGTAITEPNRSGTNSLVPCYRWRSPTARVSDPAGSAPTRRRRRTRECSTIWPGSPSCCCYGATAPPITARWSIWPTTSPQNANSGLATRMAVFDECRRVSQPVESVRGSR